MATPTVTNTLLAQDGSPAVGAVEIALVAGDPEGGWNSSAHRTYLSRIREVLDSTGTWSVALQPINTFSVSAGYYEITESVEGAGGAAPVTTTYDITVPDVAGTIYARNPNYAVTPASAPAASAYQVGQTMVDVLAFGTDTAAVQAAQAAGPSAGAILNFRQADLYTVTEPIVPTDRLTLRGVQPVSSSTPTPPVRISGAGAFAVIDDTVGVRDVVIEALTISGNGVATAGNKGIHSDGGTAWVLRDLFLTQFGDQAIHIEGGGPRLTIDQVIVENAVKIDGRSDYIGAVDVDATDAMLHRVEATVSASALGSGFRAAIVVRGTNSFVTNCIGQISDVGFVIPTGTALVTVTGVRCDLNFGHGSVIAGAANRIIGCWAYRNGRETNNNYDGWNVSNGQNVFLGNWADGDSGDANQQRDGIRDTYSGGGGDVLFGNKYVGNGSHYIRGSTVNITGSAESGWAHHNGKHLALSYALELSENSDPAAPAANKARLYAKDVGGKTALMVRFPAGAVQQIAIEP